MCHFQFVVFVSPFFSKDPFNSDFLFQRKLIYSQFFSPMLLLLGPVEAIEFAAALPEAA